jgi:predicted phosphodiesterase
MQALLISDIHSNLVALESVIRDAESNFDIDEIWATGDLVGYGPKPAECLKLLDSIGTIAVAGNHDLAVAGTISAGDFNHFAAAAVLWTRNELDESYLEQLRSLPTLRDQHGVTLAHGSPRDPIWEYVASASIARIALVEVENLGVVVGHTHQPVIYRLIDGISENVELSRAQPVTLTGSPFLVNPGSVGQPRDMDPRASYAVLDLDADQITITHRRVEYDFEKTAAQIVVAGLPPILAERLKTGF